MGHRGRHQDFPPFDKAEDPFLFGNSDGDLLQRVFTDFNSHFGFSNIVRA